MKILLVKDLKNVGKAGEIKEVSDGYGANYVIPQGYGKILNAAAMNEYRVEQKRIADEEAAKKALAEQVAIRLNSIQLVYTAKIGKSGAMIGTVSPKSIEEKLKSEFDIVIDKRRFIDHYPVNAIGVTKLRIELYKGVVGTISVVVKEEK